MHEAKVIPLFTHQVAGILRAHGFPGAARRLLAEDDLCAWSWAVRIGDAMNDERVRQIAVRAGWLGADETTAARAAT